MTRLKKGEVKFIKSCYKFFIIECFDICNCDMHDYYDIDELIYQMNDMENFDLDDYRYHARFGNYIGEVLYYCSRMKRSFKDEMKDKIFDKMREYLIKSLKSSGVTYDEFRKCIDNSPGEIKKKEFLKEFGDFPIF